MKAEIPILHINAFNSLISDLRKKNPHCDRESVDNHGSTARGLFTEEDTDGWRNLIYDDKSGQVFNLIQPSLLVV